MRAMLFSYFYFCLSLVQSTFPFHPHVRLAHTFMYTNHAKMQSQRLLLNPSRSSPEPITSQPGTICTVLTRFMPCQSISAIHSCPASDDATEYLS
ncbi:hypothetical protein BDZ45DRAFT_91052 [Acephala macrosclerotiorum]|nr:hypothetical protein BDZ45DRAFT_91052 [Acephala macrosclerotiorum]